MYLDNLHLERKDLRKAAEIQTPKGEGSRESAQNSNET